jgi:hypothetical protein
LNVVLFRVEASAAVGRYIRVLLNNICKRDGLEEAIDSFKVNGYLEDRAVTIYPNMIWLTYYLTILFFYR